MSDFEDELEADERFERRLFWRQLAIVRLRGRAGRAAGGGLLSDGRERGQPHDARRLRRSPSWAGRSRPCCPGPSLDPLLFGLACALTLALLVAASIGVVRDSPSAQLWLSLAYLGIVGLMREAGDGPAGFLPLVILPAVWLALYGTRRQLLITLAATALVLLVPWL